MLLIFSGANIPLSSLPDWMAAIGTWLPLSHSIEAARELVAGGTLGAVSGLLLREVGLGLAYGALGLISLRLLELEGRGRSTHEIQ